MCTIPPVKQEPHFFSFFYPRRAFVCRCIVLFLYLIHVPALCFYVNFSANSLFCCRTLIFDSKLVIVCLVLELSASLVISPPAVDLFLSAFIFLAFWLIWLLDFGSLNSFSFFLQLFYLTFSSHRLCRFCSTSHLISKCIVLLFHHQMKSISNFHLSFWGFPPIFPSWILRWDPWCPL